MITVESASLKKVLRINDSITRNPRFSFDTPRPHDLSPCLLREQPDSKHRAQCHVGQRAQSFRAA